MTVHPGPNHHFFTTCDGIQIGMVLEEGDHQTDEERHRLRTAEFLPAIPCPMGCGQAHDIPRVTAETYAVLTSGDKPKSSDHPPRPVDPPRPAHHHPYA